MVVGGAGPHTGHKAHSDDGDIQDESLRRWVTPTLGNKDTATARKIEYKNLVQETEAAHADVTWRGVLRAFISFKNVSLLFGGEKPLS